MEPRSASRPGPTVHFLIPESAKPRVDDKVSSSTMKYLSRVVWSEGMYLGPHHFQAQSRYFEDSARFTTSSLWFEPWGLVASQLDAEALKNGTVSLVHARGIFPDGLVFHMPESDALPPPRSLALLFPPATE